MEEIKTQMAFAAINKTLQSNIPSPREEEARGKNYVTWGDGDEYPNFLYQLYLDCATLGTIINGTSDYVVGNSVTSTLGWKYPNKKEQTWESLVCELAGDYLNFGIAYLQVIRNVKGEISEFYHLDTRFVRSDEHNEVFHYNKEFGKKYGRSSKTLIYPKFVKDAIDIPTSIICIKTPQSRGTYGTPTWGQAVKSVMTQIGIDTFHLNELDNNFTASAIINFNNGTPTDEQMDEIEKNVNEKFCGSENAGNFILSFNNGKDNATTVERIVTDDFDKRYEALANTSEKRIYTAFGANPNLFGVATENNGFNAEEYESSFKLYSRTRVRPIQMRIIDAFDKAFGVEGSLVIDPFTLDGNNETNVA